MLDEQIKVSFNRWFDTFNEHNLEKLEGLADELFTDDFILHDPDFAGLPPGPAGIKEFVRQALVNIPDIHIALEDLVTDGDKAAIRFTVRGTDQTQRKMVTLMVLVISRFVGGKLAEEWQVGRPVEG